MREGSTCYLDACVFLSYINEVNGRWRSIEALLDQAAAKRYTLYTSVLTISEVAFAYFEKAGRTLDENMEQRIDAFWEPGSPVTVVEFFHEIAVRARGVMRQGIENGWKVLRPADAVHLATAEHLEVDVLATYNLQDMQQWGPVLGFHVEHPSVEQPTLTED